MNKIFELFAGIIKRFKIVLKKVQIRYYIKFSHDAERVRDGELRKFEEFGLSLVDAEEKLNNILLDKYDRVFDRNTDSIHWLIFCALSMHKSYEKILEIGTYDGEFTHLLGQLFPQANITTVDLPIDDPIMVSTYARENPEILNEYLAKQSKNTSLKNIENIHANTLFLMDYVDINEGYDLIWVDGGHLYPDMAWDICNAYQLLKADGMLLCDDVICSEKYYSNGYVSTDSWEVLKYLEKIHIT